MGESNGVAWLASGNVKLTKDSRRNNSRPIGLSQCSNHVCAEPAKLMQTRGNRCHNAMHAIQRRIPPAQNLLKAFAAALFFITRRTLNRTVLDSGRH